MNELDRYAVSLENMEVLRAQVEAQAQEIERLQLTCNDLDDQNDRIYAELAALSANHSEQVRDALPGGWTAKPTDDREGFIISSPRINGVASHFAVFPDSNDFASCALWRMLSTSPSAGRQEKE